MAHLRMKNTIIALVVAVSLLMPFAAFAATQDLPSLIAELQAKIAELSSLRASSLSIPSTATLSFTRTLTVGSSGTDVTALQSFLKTAGYYTYPTATGFFGLVTKTAIAAFQKANGLDPIGIVGPLTRGKLNILSGAGSPTAPASPTGPAFQLYPINASAPKHSPRVSAVDTSVPTVSISAPANATIVYGASVTVSASSTDDVAVAGLQFKLDNAALMAEDTTAPYTITWDSTTASAGSHTLLAVARDTSGNLATSSPVTVTVDNAGPVLSSVSSGTPRTTIATTTWTTDELADSQIAYGLTTSYGATTTLDSSLVTSHSVTLTGLTAATAYHYRIRSADAQGNARFSSDQTFTTTAGLSISGTPVTSASQNTSYTGFTAAASGGTAPYTYSVASGSLPTGITIASNTGVVSGTPTSYGTSAAIVLRVTDATGATADLASFSLVVAPQPPAYRYVGVQIVATPQGYVGASQLSFFEQGNATDLSLAATMGSTGTNDGANIPTKLNDNNTGTFYASSDAGAAQSGPTNTTLYADFGAGNEKRIVKVGFRPRDSATAQAPSRWRLVGRNSTSDPWSQIAYLQTSHTWVSGQYDEFTVTPAAPVATLPGYQYFKVTYRSPVSGGFWSLMEVEIGDSAAGDTRSPFYTTAIATTELTASWAGGKIADQTAANGWTGANGTTADLPASVTLDYGAGMRIVPYEFRIYPRDGSLTQAPGSFKIEGSTNNSTWTTLVDQTSTSGWANATAKTFLSN